MKCHRDQNGLFFLIIICIAISAIVANRYASMDLTYQIDGTAYVCTYVSLEQLLFGWWLEEYVIRERERERVSERERESE